MPATVTLHQLSWSTPDNRPLFTGLDLSFGPGRTGLIGRNGTGKSTLLRLIAGELVPQAGSVAVTGSIGMLAQSVQVDDTSTIADALGVTEPLARLDRLEQGVGTLDDAERADWTLPQRIETALADMGLPGHAPSRPLSCLSGGQRTRIGLAALVLAQPDLILLDEPTNNLDADGRAAVIALLHRWRGAAIVVSHDRTLLREMDAIVELTSLGATAYGGNWDHYAERKAQELAGAEHDLAVAARRASEAERKIQLARERQARADSAGRRKAAKGDIPKLLLGGRKENAEKTAGGNSHLAERLRGEAGSAASAARARIEVLTPLTVRLAPTLLPAGRMVLDAANLTGGPATIPDLINNFSLTLAGPERVAITGPNGSGKTTLLNLLTGRLPPASGTARIAVPFALLDQTVSLLDPALTIRDNFLALNPGADELACRAALARFMFRADAALQIVGTLSGGQMLRAGLAATIGAERPPQLLILDEPTNHLDIHAIAEVEAGLKAYDGALLVVSHDADFLAAIGTTKQVSLA